jgi:hypothetical protein
VSQIKEQLEAIGDTIEEAELVMTTLNGLPIYWESFIQGICSRRRITRFTYYGRISLRKKLDW